MGTEAPTGLPILDFSNPGLNPGTPEWESLKSHVKKALEEYGCFQAFFKKEPGNEELETAINFSTLDKLFDVPLETKTPKESENPSHAYFGQLPHRPLFECFSNIDPTTLEKIESFSKRMWPQGNPDFSKTLHSFAEKVLGFYGTLTRMILESLGVEKYLDELENWTRYNIGIQKYEEPKTNEAKVGLNSHKDSNIMTILYQNHVGGLEIETKNGDWISAAPPPDSFIVVAGESLDAWTNGRFQAPFHRVMMAGNERRYSVGLFACHKPGYIVKAPQELVDEEHPLAYKPFDYSEFRKYRQQYHSQSPKLFDLKSYCGVN